MRGGVLSQRSDQLRDGVHCRGILCSGKNRGSQRKAKKSAVQGSAQADVTACRSS